MTKKEAVINYLKTQGIDITKHWHIEETERYQRPGTLLIHELDLSREERDILLDLYHKRGDDDCPIEIHGVRDRFEWQYNLTRIFFAKGVDWRKYAV